MSFTFDLLKENETFAMHDRQQIPVAKLSHLEQFYTDVSKVYDHQLINHTVPTISGDTSEKNVDIDMDNDDEENDDDKKGEESALSAIIDNLDKARYQLDEMCQVIDMLTNNAHPNKLFYKLSRPLSYPPMNRRHFCAVAQQKTDQYSKVIDILKNGTRSVRKSIEKGRNFSKNLCNLSKYWRLTTLEVLKYDNMIKDNIPQSNTSNTRMNVFIDYRLQRKRNVLSGLLPLKCTKKSGNIQIQLNNPSEIVKHLKQTTNNEPINNKNDADKSNKKGKKEEKENQNVVGFDDEDEDEDDDMFNISESDDDTKDNESEENMEDDNDEVLSDWWRICEFVYQSQINLLYLELFNALRIEVSHWNPSHFNGICCKLELNAIHIHSPSLSDFVIQFYAPDFVKNCDDESNVNENEMRWNKFGIIGEDESMNDAFSKEIEENVLKMLFNKWKRQNNAPMFVDDTLSALKREEMAYSHNLDGRAVFNKRGIGMFEKKKRENDDMQNNERKSVLFEDVMNEQQQKEHKNYNECEILEYIVNKVNHRRLANGMKKSLISFSKKNPMFDIKWNQLNAKSIVTVTVSKRGKLLLNLTLNGIKMTAIKYRKNRSKPVSCSSAQQLQKILNSFI